MAGWALLRQRDSGTPPMASAIPVLELGPERLSQAHSSALLLVLGEGPSRMCPAHHPGWQSIPAGP